MPTLINAWKKIVQCWISVISKITDRQVDVLRARHANGRSALRQGPDRIVRRMKPADDVVRRDATMVEMSINDLRDLQRLRTEASLRRAEEATMIVPAQAVDDMGWESYERIHRLREALDGIGHVGAQFDSQGRPVGNQVSVSLTMHEAEALMLLLTKRRAPAERVFVNEWETVGGL